MFIGKFQRIRWKSMSNASYIGGERLVYEVTRLTTWKYNKNIEFTKSYFCKNRTSILKQFHKELGLIITSERPFWRCLSIFWNKLNLSLFFLLNLQTTARSWSKCSPEAFRQAFCFGTTFTDIVLLVYTGYLLYFGSDRSQIQCTITSAQLYVRRNRFQKPFEQFLAELCCTSLISREVLSDKMTHMFVK